MKVNDLTHLKNFATKTSSPFYKNAITDYYLSEFEGLASACGKDILGNVSASIVKSVTGSRVMLCSSFSTTVGERSFDLSGRQSLYLGDNYLNLGCFVIFSAMKKLLHNSVTSQLGTKVFGVLSPVDSSLNLSTGVAADKIKPSACVFIKPLIVPRSTDASLPIIPEGLWVNPVLHDFICGVSKEQNIKISTPSDAPVDELLNIAPRAGGIACSIVYIPVKKWSGRYIVNLNMLSKTSSLICSVLANVADVHSFVI